MRQQPREREVEHGVAALRRERLELQQARLVLLVAHLADDARATDAARARGRLLAGAVLSGEEATGQREVRQERDVALLAVGQDLELDVPAQQVVVVLRRDHERPALRLSDGVGLDVPP